MTPPAPLPVPGRAPARRRLIIAGGVALAGLVLLTVPWWGRQLAFFRVHDVEVRGTRLLKASEIVTRLGIDTMHSIWEPLDSLQARVERHPQVASARIRRWLPSTLIVEVTENLPVAFVPGRNGLRAYDEEGKALPLDPSRVPTDLPIISAPDTGVLRLLADLRADRPEIYARISEVRLVGKDQLRLELVDVPVLAMRTVSTERFDELSSVQRDLARRRIVPVELDLRFKDQVIARVP
jgi:cell division protein FtsQ